MRSQDEGARKKGKKEKGKKLRPAVGTAASLVVVTRWCTNKNKSGCPSSRLLILIIAITIINKMFSKGYLLHRFLQLEVTLVVVAPHKSFFFFSFCFCDKLPKERPQLANSSKKERKRDEEKDGLAKFTRKKERKKETLNSERSKAKATL